MRVERAEEMEGGGWKVLGLKDDGSGEGVRCLLLGEGKGDVRVGGTVGEKGLGWRFDVDGQGEWWVGVGWEGGEGSVHSVVRCQTKRITLVR